MPLRTMALARGWAARGHRVWIITTRHPQGITQIQEEGVETRFARNGIPGAYSWLWWQETSRMFRELYEQAQVEVICSDNVAAVGLLKRAKEANIPLAAIINGHFGGELRALFRQARSPRRLLTAATKHLARLLYYYVRTTLFLQATDAVIAVSDDVAQALSRWYFVDEARVRTIYNGVDTDKFYSEAAKGEAFRRQHGLGLEEPVLLVLSRLDRLKGVQVALQAFREVLATLPQACLFIVGRGPYEAELHQLAQQLGIASRVYFCGFLSHEQTPLAYNACNIFWMPSLYTETFPTTVLEAMACGKVVVASARGGVLGMIDHAVDGFLVPPGNASALATTTLEILQDPVRVERVGTRAEAKVRQKFTREKMIEGILNVLMDIRQDGLESEEEGKDAQSTPLEPGQSRP